MFKVIVPETNASRHLFFTNKSIQREGMVAETRGAVLYFPRRGDPQRRPLAQISQKPPEKINLKPTDRIADLLPFSKSEQNQTLFHPVDIFAFPSPPRDY